jgi:hypothetical protein
MAACKVTTRGGGCSFDTDCCGGFTCHCWGNPAPSPCVYTCNDRND